MQKLRVYVNGAAAGVLEKLANDYYRFEYDEAYQGAPVSLTMPIKNKSYEYQKFPPFFEGLLPEGIMLEALLRKYKLDKSDYFSQLMQVGKDVVGAVTVEALE